MNIIHYLISIPICIYAYEADHLLITQVVTQKDEAESISIHNPTDSPIDLHNYYICDDEEYYKMQTEFPNAMAPSHFLHGFTARFPQIIIPAGDTLHIVLNENYSEFYGEDFIPDLVMYGSGENSMLETDTNSFGMGDNKIDESSELIILFKWDGDSEHLIEDVDYFLWGEYYPRINKTGIPGYQQDSSPENQYFDGVAQEDYAYSRIGIDEIGEIESGGNGITGHDETSEDFRQSWEIIELFNFGCTDEAASNYDPEAEINDESCEYLTTIYDIIHNCGNELGESIECSGQYDLSTESAEQCPLYEKSLTTSGIIVDYFDITVFNGPHSFTIKDPDGNQIDFVVWPENSSFQDGFDITQSNLNVLTQAPYGMYEVKITGELGAYCDDDEMLNINSEWQVTIEYESDLVIVAQYNPEDLGCTDPGNPNYNPDALIDDGSCYITISEIYSGSYDGQPVTTQGTIVDYFDITVFNGPHAITIEDEDYNELELTIWPDYWDETLAEYASCPYARYEIEVTGIVNEYCKDTCDNFATEISCNADDDCMWSSGSCIEEECEIKYTSKIYCDGDEDCMWNLDDGICEKDCTSENNWECSIARSTSDTDYNDDYPDWDYLSQSMQECSWQLEVTGISNIEVLETHEVPTQLVSFQDVLDGDYYHQSIKLAGVITDYFDITKFCGPHAITISDGTTCHSLELSIWDDDWSNELECLTQPPFFTKAVQVTGFVGEYEGETQIQMCGEITILNENYDYQTCEASISSILDGSQDDKIVTCEGLLVDYFDVTVYDGPHALTIEDEQGYRLELSIWPNTYDIPNSVHSYLLQEPYNRYFLSAMGSVTEYEGEKQLTISGANSITVTDTISLEGTEYTGLMVTFIIETEYENFVDDEDEFDREEDFKIDLAALLGISKARILIIDVKQGSVILDINIQENVAENYTEPSNDDLLEIIPNIVQVSGFDVEIEEIVQLSVNTTIIKPVPYVIIPTLGEKLDFTYSYPKNSRVIIRIYDLSGRFVTSLVDKYYEESATVFRVSDQSSWDGRDKLGQIVAPGTYIMHIETINPSTGATQMDAAPVVVGVKN